MIKLLVEDYCHECPEFYPEKVGGDALYSEANLVHITDIIVKCDNYDKCCIIKEHLDKQSGERRRKL